MPGFEMPARGGGAAMLRDLREEERPALQDPALQEHAPPPIATAGQNGRNSQTDSEENQSYDNMTNKLTEHKTSKQSVKQTRKPESKPVAQKTNLPVSQVASPSVAANNSVADMIRQRAAQRGEQEVLKTVTLKLSPSLDERIERYCFENKMKKQDFWAEAAALYFETVEHDGGSQ